MYDKNNPLHYREIFETFEGLNWKTYPQNLQIYSIIGEHPIHGVKIEVDMFLFPNESMIANCFLFEMEEHTNRYARSFLKALKKVLVPRGLTLKQISLTNYQIQWNLAEPGLFEDYSQKEIIQKMLEQYKKGCLFACSYVYAIHECATNSKKQDHSALIDFCLLGFMGFDARKHA